MADLIWTVNAPLRHDVMSCHHGVPEEHPGILLSDVRGFSLVQILARRGQWPRVAQATKAHFGVEAPTKPQAVRCGKGVLIWSGPDQMMALLRRTDHIRPIDTLGESFAGAASLSDQSDSRCMIRISGARIRNMLAKVASIDLDDSVFPIGAAAATSINHTGVNLWREPDGSDGQPVFAVLVLSSFAGSLWHTLFDSSAEYGVALGVFHQQVFD